MILSIDQGTTGTTALLVDAAAAVAGAGYAPVRQHYPRPGWVEHDPQQIWASVGEAVAQARRAAGDPALAAVGIANQRETAVAWSARSGQPLGPAIGWQCRRTAGHCAVLRERGDEPRIRQQTGLVLDPYFSATKFAWLLEHVPAVAEARAAGDLRLGTVDAWLVWQLSGGAHATDVSNASRTMLLDINTGAWSPELADLFEVPLGALPAVADSAGEIARTAGAGPVPAGVPIAGIAGDQQAALFGHLAAEPGVLKCTYGTGCFLLQDAGTARPVDAPGLVTTLAARAGGPLQYALEGSVFVAGALVQWLRDELGLIQDTADIERLARRVDNAGGAVIVPAFTGLGAPHWDPTARGAIVGLTRGVTREHLCRAALEAIAHQVADVTDLLPPGAPPLRVDGGAAANDLLLGLQATLLRRPVRRPAQLETTALGAAYLAGLGVGLWSDRDEIRRLRAPDRIFEPDAALAITPRATWQRAVERAAGWTEAGDA